MKISFDVTFFEEFTFSVSADLASAEPDIGLFHGYVEDWKITSVDGCNHPEVLAFFANKISNSKPLSDDWEEKLAEKAFDAETDHNASLADWQYEQRKDREMEKDWGIEP
jgi:hypothetical protein